VSEDRPPGRFHCLDAEGQPLFLYGQVVRAADAKRLPPGVPHSQLQRGVIVQIIDTDRMRVRWPATKYAEVMRSRQVLKVEPPTSRSPIGEPG
jgi:hypothetical protein